MFIPDKWGNVAQNSRVAEHAAAAFTAWARKNNLPEGEESVLMTYLENLGSIVTASDKCLQSIPVEEDTKAALHRFFGSKGRSHAHNGMESLPSSAGPSCTIPTGLMRSPPHPITTLRSSNSEHLLSTEANPVLDTFDTFQNQTIVVTQGGSDLAARNPPNRFIQGNTNPGQGPAWGLHVNTGRLGVQNPSNGMATESYTGVGTCGSGSVPYRAAAATVSSTGIDAFRTENVSYAETAVPSAGVGRFGDATLGYAHRSTPSLPNRHMMTNYRDSIGYVTPNYQFQSPYLRPAQGPPGFASAPTQQHQQLPGGNTNNFGGSRYGGGGGGFGPNQGQSVMWQPNFAMQRQMVDQSQYQCPPVLGQNPQHAHAAPLPHQVQQQPHFGAQNRNQLTRNATSSYEFYQAQHPYNGMHQAFGHVRSFP